MKMSSLWRASGSEVRQEIIVGSAGAAVNDEERLAASEGLVVDHDAVGVDVTFADGIDGGAVADERFEF